MNIFKILSTFLFVTFCGNSMAFSFWPSQPAKPAQQVKNNQVTSKKIESKPVLSFNRAAQVDLANIAGISYVLSHTPQIRAFYNNAKFNPDLLKTNKNLQKLAYQEAMISRYRMASLPLCMLAGWEAGNYFNSANNNFKNGDYKNTAKDLSLTLGLGLAIKNILNPSKELRHEAHLAGAISTAAGALIRSKQAYDAWQKNDKEEAFKNAAIAIGLTALGIVPLISNKSEIEIQRHNQ